MLNLFLSFFGDILLTEIKVIYIWFSLVYLTNKLKVKYKNMEFIIAENIDGQQRIQVYTLRDVVFLTNESKLLHI